MGVPRLRFCFRNGDVVVGVETDCDDEAGTDVDEEADSESDDEVEAMSEDEVKAPALLPPQPGLAIEPRIGRSEKRIRFQETRVVWSSC